MADFVAVIRRAVDGLATNTPEARVRVYEKARGAVQRQLENMKPRPPEDMLRRQMDKLEAAILEVEGEHAEALPAEPEAVAAPVVLPADIYEERQPEPVAPEPEAEPVASQVHPAETVDEDVPVTADEPVVAEPAAPHSSDYVEETSSQAPEVREEESWQTETAAAEEAPPVEEQRWEPAAEPVAVEPVEPVEQHWQEEPVAEPQVAASEEVVAADAPRFGDWRDDVPEGQAPEAEHEAHPVDPQYPQAVEQTDALYPVSEDERATEAEQAAAEWLQHHPTEASSVDQMQQTEAAHAEWPEPAVSNGDPAPQAGTPNVWDEVDDLTRHLDAPVGRGSADAYFSPEMRATATPVRMPAASDDIPQPEQPPVADERQAEDPFEAYVNAQPASPDPVSQPAAASQQQEPARDPWSDLEDLIGYTKEAQPAGQQSKDEQPVIGQDARSEDDFSDLLAAPAKPYRVTAKRKRNYTGIIIGAVALVLLAGGAYGVWQNRDTLNEMVGGLLSSDSDTTEPTSTANTSDGSETPSTPETPAPEAQEGASAPTAAPDTATPPAADGSTAGGKFTQRLLEDGNEVDEGPGGSGALAQNAEGQSVSQLNAPPADPAASTAPANTAGAAGTAPAAPSASPTDAPAAAGERMFLYEERIGQTAPTAIEGSVSWSLQREPAPNGGPAEPVVQGRITVPGRGLTALLTVKRNTDSSLPASHLIEIVFAVPPDFEGGSIDSVLRIAMKQTEQDRGNALVAVPAKITDDFHMIALNDFPDARATNMDLLRTRNWMDIPVAYRNGRRALLTLQKGPEGSAAFDEAIREWGQ